MHLNKSADQNKTVGKGKSTFPAKLAGLSIIRASLHHCMGLLSNKIGACACADVALGQLAHSDGEQDATLSPEHLKFF